MSEGNDKFHVKIEFKIPGAFGQYSLLGAEVGVEGACDLTKGPEELKKVVAFWGTHCAGNVQELQNKVLVLTGRKPYWGDSGQPAEPPKEEGKEEARRKPRRSDA